MRLSNQAVGALMLALQKGLMDRVDITGLLKEFELVVNSENEVEVKNPPTGELKEPD